MGNDRIFEEDVMNEEEPGLLKKAWKNIKKHPGQLVLALLGAAVGGLAVNNAKNKEIKKISKANNELIDMAYDRGKIDGTLQTYDRIIFTKDVE